jgi:hypothetical protein
MALDPTTTFYFDRFKKVKKVSHWIKFIEKQSEYVKNLIISNHCVIMKVLFAGF